MPIKVLKKGIQDQVHMTQCTCLRSFRIHQLVIAYCCKHGDYDTLLNFLHDNDISLNLCQLSLYSYGSTPFLNVRQNFLILPSWNVFLDLLTKSLLNFFHKSTHFNINIPSLIVTYSRPDMTL